MADTKGTTCNEPKHEDKKEKETGKDPEKEKKTIMAQPVDAEVEVECRICTNCRNLTSVGAECAVCGDVDDVAGMADDDDVDMDDDDRDSYPSEFEYDSDDERSYDSQRDIWLEYKHMFCLLCGKRCRQKRYFKEEKKDKPCCLPCFEMKLAGQAPVQALPFIWLGA